MKKNNAILGVVFLIFHCLMARGAPLLSDENGLAPLPVTNERKSYAIVTDPRNALSIATIRQLQPCHIYMVCVPKDRETAERVVQRLQTVEPKTYEITICTFDPFGTKERVQASAMECIRKINCRDQLDGVLFNPYGSVGDGNPRPGTGLLALSEYKLIGNAILLQALLSQRILKEKSRIIFSGSEAARGLPKMGIVPALGTTKESVEARLTGVAYNMHYPNDGNRFGIIRKKTNVKSSYQWEHAYANLSAIGVLYMSSLAKYYPHHYFGTVSPGMTQESLNPRHVDNASLGLVLKLLACRFLMFPLLKRWEIVQDIEDSAAYFKRALTGEDWDYPNGTFVGARRGTSGPICDQSSLPSGKIFLNQSMQQIAYEAVQNFLP